MSGSIKMLDEIDARVKASTPGRWFWGHVDNPKKGGLDACLAAARKEGRRNVSERLFVIRESGENAMCDADLIKHAPTDLALLSHLVRIVAESRCERIGPGNDSICTKFASHIECWPCRIRRKLTPEPAKCL